MSHRCLRTEDLAALAVLPPDDPRRREAEGCPRCAGQLAACAAFLAGDPDLPAGELGHAESLLAAHLGAALVADRPARRPAAVSPRRLGAGVALAAAAVLAVVVLVPRDGAVPTGPSGVVRGGGHRAGLAPLAPVAVADTAGEGLPPGSLRLWWPPVAGSDRYEIVILGAALDTLAVLGPVAAPPAIVPGSVLGTASGGAFGRVRALAAAVPLAESPLVPLPVR